jgi:DNA-binding GntR family transcriptional regulator
MARLCVGQVVTVCDVGIDKGAPDWPYQQAAARIRERIAAGELGPRLPSYMDLAHELGVSPMTVQRAIGVLRDEGLVVTRPGRGTFVTTLNPG